MLSQQTIVQAQRRVRETLVAKNPQAGSKSIRLDPTPIVDSNAFNWADTCPAVVPPIPQDAGTLWRPQITNGATWNYFTGENNLVWQNGAVTQTMDKTDKWAIHPVKKGIMPITNCFACFGFFFRFFPYPGAKFENWFLNEINPILRAKIGKRSSDRFTGSLNNFVNVRSTPMAQYPATAAAAAMIGYGSGVNAGVSMLPISIWNDPWMIEPEDQIEIHLDYKNCTPQSLTYEEVANGEANFAANGGYIMELPQYIHEKYWVAATFVPRRTTQTFLLLQLGLIGILGSVS